MFREPTWKPSVSTRNQAAEKAIKGVLLSRGIRFPYVHDLGALVALAARDGVPVPEEIVAAARLTDYAVLTRYPLPDASRRTRAGATKWT